MIRTVAPSRGSTKTWQRRAKTVPTVSLLQQSLAATGSFLVGRESKMAMLVALGKSHPTLCRIRRNFTGARSRITRCSCTRRESASCQMSIRIQCIESRSGLLRVLKSFRWMRRKYHLLLEQAGQWEQSSAKASKVVCKVINRESTPILEQTSRIK